MMIFKQRATGVASTRYRLMRLLCICLPLLVNSAVAQNYTTDPNYPGRGYQPPTGKYPDNGGNSSSKKWVLPAIVAGAAAIAVIHNALSKKPTPEEVEDIESSRDPELESQLREHGPDFSHLYNMSAMMMIGFVQGGWPLVIDFEQENPGYVELMVKTRSSDTFRYRLDGGESGHRHIVLPLPPVFGDEPTPALIAVTATTKKNSDQTLAGFKLIGLGAGPRAIGSVAVDKVSFASNKIHSSEGQKTSYSFFAHSTFENTDVDFMKIIDDDDGEKHEWVNQQNLAGGVTENQWAGEDKNLDWDGANHESELSIGAHKIQVRVWHNKGDWVSAWSNSAVFVE